MDLEGFAKTITVYARAAFVVCVGEQVVRSLVSDPGYSLAQHALGVAARWVAGGDFVGDSLSDLLMDANEDGILTFEQLCKNDEAAKAYLCLESVLAYVAWHSYRMSGKHVGSLVSEVSEATVSLVVSQAEIVETYDPQCTEQFYEYLLVHCQSDGSSQLGRPIDLEQLKQHARLGPP